MNEQLGIEKTLYSIPVSKIHNLGYELEVLVVDTCSTDSTREVAKKMGAKVIIEKRKGYGCACKTGFCAAKGDILVTLDADNTYPAECIAEYIIELNQNNLDFITINRFADMEKGALSITRIIGNKILTFVMRLLYSIKIRDSQSGMWIIRKDFISKIRLNSDGMSMSEEIKIIAFKFFKALELDGKYYNRIGKSNVKIIPVGWENLKYLVAYKKHLKSSVISPECF